MVVLELALLQIQPSTSAPTPADTPLTPALRADLTHALSVLRAASGHPFTLLQQHEDPRALYILGHWPSVAAHEAFLPSQPNQDLLARVAGTLDISYMQHVDVATQPDPSTAPSAVTALLDAAPVLAIGRHTVAGARRSAFQAAWEPRRPLLEAAAGRACVGGWRVGRVYGAGEGEQRNEGDEEEEWVLLSGWDAVARHGEFAASEAFDEYGKVREFVARFDVKHASRVATSE